MPMTEILKKDGSSDSEIFKPSAAFVRSFETLKQKLISAPILGHPDFESDSPFILDTGTCCHHPASAATPPSGLE